MPEEPSYLDEIHQDIVEFANRHIEDDDEREGFVDTLLERHGYQKVSNWGPPADPKAGGRKPGGLLKPPGPKKTPYFKGK